MKGLTVRSEQATQRTCLSFLLGIISPTTIKVLKCSATWLLVRISCSVLGGTGMSLHTA